jgi:sortase A
VALRIVIDAIGVDAPVVEGDDWEALKKGVGHHPGSANPGQRGNMVVSAHNDVFGELFRDLDQLEAGDEVWVHTQDSSYRYIVRETRIVEPTEVTVMEASREPILTMITCYPYGVDSHRVVALADLAP